MYTSFAEVYDELMADVDYSSWASYYAELMAKAGVLPGARICECACGTGGLTIPLQEMGFGVTGIDLSQEMLWIAAQKARASGSQAVFVRQDMRRLRLHRPVDAVLATCDGVNYLTTDSDLTDFLRAAHDTLKPGGALVFDVSTPYKLEHILGGRLLCEDTPRVTYMWQNRWQTRSRCLDLHLCIFVRDLDGRYRRMDEDQRQRAWSVEELRASMAAVGFVNIAFFGDRTPDAPRPEEERWHVMARRQEELPEA